MSVKLPFVDLLKLPTERLFKQLTTVKVQEPKLTVGLDIGATCVKIVALGPKKSDGRRPLLGHALVPLEAGQDSDASEAIKTAVSNLKMPITSVTLSVSGQWVIMRVLEMPKMKAEEFKQALPFEAQRYLPFNIQEVVLDGAVLGASDGNKAWALIVACKKNLLERRIDWAKRAGVSVDLIDVDALALANAFLATASGEQLKKTQALIDVGGQLTNLVIIRGGVTYLVRDIPWGGEKLIRKVAEQLGSDPDAVSQALAQDQPSPEMVNALKVSSEVLASELQLSFDYFENRFNQPPEDILVTGGLSQAKPFLEGLKAHLTQAVIPWSPIQELPTQFAVAYGLALRTE